MLFATCHRVYNIMKGVGYMMEVGFVLEPA
jgi:hypothetical protein